MKAGSKLEQILSRGEFAVTGELGPPKGADTSVVERKAKLLRDNVDAINVTDNQTAIVRMSSIAVSALLQRMGLEPTMQMVCRDRNRIAMQSDLFGAYALGIRNLLCLSGDHQRFGNHPPAKNVFDLDSMQLLQMVKRMRDEKKVLTPSISLFCISVIMIRTTEITMAVANTRIPMPKLYSTPKKPIKVIINPIMPNT